MASLSKACPNDIYRQIHSPDTQITGIKKHTVTEGLHVPETIQHDVERELTHRQAIFMLVSIDSSKVDVQCVQIKAPVFNCFNHDCERLV